MKTQTPEPRLIETDAFPFEFLSHLAERESWRKEIHRPIYHVHKWWAKRLGSVFRGILLGATHEPGVDLSRAFYETHALRGVSVFDPFMGSGTTVGEAHKLGMTALGRDINPVAVEAVKTALGPLQRARITSSFQKLSETVGESLRALYVSKDREGRSCEVLYFFWVMQAACPECSRLVELFSSNVVARNAYPTRKPEVQVRCPKCGDLFKSMNDCEHLECPACRHHFGASAAPAKGAKATCPHCDHRFTIIDAIGVRRPAFRLYAKLVLTADGRKEYLPATKADLADYRKCSRILAAEIAQGRIRLPELRLTKGHNTRQAMSYNFMCWRDFFNDRQLLALGRLHAEIDRIADGAVKAALFTLFSGVLEFNNLFASYKGEGTGAVRHMFAHHILKPERTPIEANLWGTRKSSGGFSTLFRSRLLRAIDYREAPTELNGLKSPGRVCAKPFSGVLQDKWPTNPRFGVNGIYLSQGDSSATGLPSGSIDLVVTDPPFFDNVHYSELADFFYAWRQLESRSAKKVSTRHSGEVQDADPARFATKLSSVFAECHRVLRRRGLLIFTYHHSRAEGWESLARAIHEAGFVVVNSQPVKAEMSVAAPKSQAKEPIQLDIIVVCRKANESRLVGRIRLQDALYAGRDKLRRLEAAGFMLSRNDRRVVLCGQLLTAVATPEDAVNLRSVIDAELDSQCPPRSAGIRQTSLV